MDQQYDEDLTQNSFYSCLTKHHFLLYDKAVTARWTICVPRVGSIGDIDLNKTDFENHILLPKDEDLGHYRTINDKDVIIQNNVITTDDGFTQHRKIPILFEETFFNKKEESYRVLCVNQLLEGGDDTIEVPGAPVYSYANRSVEECANLLWGTTGNHRTRKHLGELIDAFHKSLGLILVPNIKQLLITCNAFFSKAMTIVMRDPYMKQMAQTDHNFQDNVKLAIENHLMYGVHKRLFRMLCTCQASKDTQLNKLTRNLTHIQLQHLGVRVEFCQNVPRARKELSNLTLHRTPTGKLNCIKKIVAALTRSRAVSKADIGVPIALTTDDLLPILVFLVLKADISNWWAHFDHMTAFRFSRSNYDDEFGFYLATLEAALDYVSSGELLDLEPNQCLDTPQIRSPNTREEEVTLWHKQDETCAAIDTLFQYVKDKNKAAVLEILQKSRSRQSRLSKLGPSQITTQSLCHPLCTCDKCKNVLQSANKEQESSHVTVYSTDAKGYAVLHVAAFYGHVEIADIVIDQGASVNTTDFLNQTPLHIACRMGHQAMALLLLHNGAVFNERDGDGNTPLHLAALHGHDDCAKALVFFDQGERSLNMNPVNDFGDTPLHLATKWGFTSLVILLLENGASASIKNRKNHEALRYAHNDIIAEHIKTAITKETEDKMMQKRLLQLQMSKSLYSSLSSQVTKSQKPVLVNKSALSRSQSHGVLRIPPDISRRNSEASVSSSRARSKTVDDASGHVNVTRKIDKLLKAIADGDIQMAKFHLGWTSDSEEDEDINDVDFSQGELCHPLCLCEKCQPFQKFSMISSTSEIHVNSQDVHGYTPLHVAAHNSHVNLVELLLRHGANVNIRTSSQGTTPLHMACRQPNIEVLHCLLKRVVEINAQDDDGNTPLHYCSMMGNERKARLLIEYSAEVNLANKKGNTPLHDAVRWNFINVVRLLIRSGALVYSRNMDNKLPIHYAQTEQMSKMLRSALALRKPAREKSLITNDLQPLTTIAESNVAEQTMSDPPQDKSDAMVTARFPCETDELGDEPHQYRSYNNHVDSTDQNPLSSIPDVDSSQSHSETDTETITYENRGSKDMNQSAFSALVDIEDLLSDECDEISESNEPDCSSNVRCQKNPGELCADGYFDINLDEDILDSNLTIIENHYGEKDSCVKVGCSHDNSSECDSCSENSKTESQQDLCID